ncbi:DUF4307 domain-containing protein [Nocardiopsis sp. EMB25]|uniref:DUF4307 domain-containing protein n=1 Tax=Nocardiopsis TaxID=2013 RepID=UPI00034A5308|nr:MULTISPECIES: DUF4307 domain-containing protein [Nocardiopsis]MCY9787688.1 DUF4307 domain-containing protein [Nocardiopsis sp. EMB25]
MPATPEEAAVNSADAAPALRKRHGNGPLFFLFGTIFAVITAVGWGYSVMNYNGLAGGVYHQVVSFEVRSADEARITFEVNSQGGARCLVSALDDQMVQVGQDSVTVEPGNRMVTTSVDTLRQASTVEVASCREQDPQN